jgi:GntR family transcriptional regulator, phosphonate transport system regulatory protein
MSLYAVDPSRGGVPLYRQISRKIAEEVHRLPPGAQLPPEPVLAERFAVNRHTLRHAIDELITDGLLERRRGRGVFVLDGVLNYSIHKHTRFTKSLEAAGNPTESVVLRKQLVPARDGVARHLGLGEGAEVLWVETLRKANERPFSVIAHFLPAALAEPIRAEYDGGSLHDFIAARLGIALEREYSLITAQLPQGDDATLLGIPRHQPVLRLKTVNVNAATREPVEYALGRLRGDRVELEVRL